MSGFDGNGQPWCVQGVGHPTGPADQPSGKRTWSHGYQQPLAASPDGVVASGCADVTQLMIDPFGSDSQGEFPECREVGFFKEIFRCTYASTRQIHLALLQALSQLRWRQVDELNFVGTIEHRVWDRFLDGSTRYLVDDIGATFQVLNIESGENVDTRGEQFLHVLKAFSVTGTWSVGVRQFVQE